MLHVPHAPHAPQAAPSQPPPQTAIIAAVISKPSLVSCCDAKYLFDGKAFPYPQASVRGHLWHWCAMLFVSLPVRTWKRFIFFFFFNSGRVQLFVHSHACFLNRWTEAKFGGTVFYLVKPSNFNLISKYSSPSVFVSLEVPLVSISSDCVFKQRLGTISISGDLFDTN